MSHVSGAHNPTTWRNAFGKAEALQVVHQVYLGIDTVQLVAIYTRVRAGKKPPHVFS
jgi:hypothetical protein